MLLSPSQNLALQFKSDVALWGFSTPFRPFHAMNTMYPGVPAIGDRRSSPSLVAVIVRIYSVASDTCNYLASSPLLFLLFLSRFWITVSTLSPSLLKILHSADLFSLLNSIFTFKSILPSKSTTPNEVTSCCYETFEALKDSDRRNRT